MKLFGAEAQITQKYLAAAERSEAAEGRPNIFVLFEPTSPNNKRYCHVTAERGSDRLRAHITSCYLDRPSRMLFGMGHTK